MSAYVNQLRRLVEAVTIESPDCAHWYGRAISSVTKIVPSDQRPVRALARLRDGLQTHLYHSFYCTGGATPWPPGSAPGHESRNFRVLLAGSHSARGSWSPGWDIWEPAGHGLVGVAHDELQCWAPLADLAEHEEPIAPGDTVKVRVPAERLRTFPGFYGILGGKDLTSREIARFYWNIEHGGASILLRELSAPLETAGVAYRLKVVSDPSAYCRCDAGVLYIDQFDIAKATKSIRHAYFMVREQLKPQVPTLTRRLAAGLRVCGESQHEYELRISTVWCYCGWSCSVSSAEHYLGYRTRQHHYRAFRTSKNFAGPALPQQWLEWSRY